MYQMTQRHIPEDSNLRSYRHENLTSHNTTYRPQSLFLRFVWFSEDAGIFSVNMSLALIFVIMMQCVFGALTTDFLTIV
jgi:hypothetical protein